MTKREDKLKDQVASLRDQVAELKKKVKDVPQETASLRRENQRLRRKFALQDGAVDAIKSIVTDLFDDWQFQFDIPTPVPVRRYKNDDECIAIAHFTDLQCGKVTKTYSSEIARMRSLEYAQKVSKAICRRNSSRKIDTLHVYWGGDMVEGELIFAHQAHEIDQSVFDQACVTVPRIMTEMVAHWLQHFQKIKIFAVSGNHGRPASRNAGSHPRTNWDRVCYTVAKAMIEKMMAENDPKIPASRVEVNIADDFYAIDEALGHKNLLIHGDQIRGGFAGFPWYGLGRKMGGWIDSIDEEWNHVYFGHFHQMVSGDMNGRRYYCGGTPESDNEFARAELAAAGRPQQRLQILNAEQVICDLPIYLNYAYPPGSRTKRR